MGKFLGKRAEVLEQLAGVSLGRRVGREPWSSHPLLGAMTELEVRGSKPPWADSGLKLEDIGCMMAPETVPDMETLPRLLHLPFLGSTMRWALKQSLSPCHVPGPLSIQPPLVVPPAAIPGGNYFHHSQMTEKGGSWRCSDLLPLHYHEI